MNKIERCTWVEEDNDNGTWETGCGNTFYFTDGGPTENEMVYCCYCGARLVEKRENPNEEEDE